jgi:O-antigen/teichoic acid export membrane protein
MKISGNSSALNRSIIAVSSQGVTVLITLLSIPFLISLFGIKDYAIFGLFLTFQALSSILEGGASLNIIKEVSSSGLNTSLTNSILLYKRIFYISLIICFIAAIIVFNNWDYSFDEILIYSFVLAISVSIRLITNFYKSISFGLNKHNYVNIFTIFFYLFRFIVPLILEMSIINFLYYQILLFILEFYFFRFLSPIKSDLSIMFNFDFKTTSDDKFREENKFTKNIIFLTFLYIVIINFDKTLISIFGSQEIFGGFQAVTSLSGGLLILLGPINSVYQPLLIGAKNNNKLFLKTATSYGLILILGFGSITMFLLGFGDQILKFWLSDIFTTTLLELFNYHLVFTFGLSLMSFAYMYSLAKNNFNIYIKYLIILLLLIAGVYLFYFISGLVVLGIFLGAIICLIMSFIIITKFGNKAFVQNFKKESFILLLVTFMSVLMITGINFFKIDSSFSLFVYLIYSCFFISRIKLFKFLFKSLKETR